MRSCRTLPTRLSTIPPRASSLPKSLAAASARPLSTSKMMSLWTPRHPSGFSSLFRMLDDFERHAQQTVGRPIGMDMGMGMAGNTMTDSLSTISPKFDMTEQEGSYLLQGELPGVSPEDVDIEFTDPQTMVIRGHTERKHTEGDPSLMIGQGKEPKKVESGKESKKDIKKEDSGKKEGKEDETKGKEDETTDKPSGPRYWLSERSFGEFSRVFNFPASVDQDKVEAKFNNGVLNIIVPKMEKKGGRKIEIK